ncbi:hypothetical protein FQA39_LY12686 [Lamprigera yunnana]|nr:hypothetical protein FQA39_LY12686 [Lamprigera yunnana]
MASGLSQIKIATDSEQIIEEFKRGKKYRYLVLNLDDCFLSVTSSGEKCKAVLENINFNRFQYILYHHESEEDRSVNSGFVIVAWFPKNVEDEVRDLYEKSVTFVKVLLKVDNLLIVNDVDNQGVKKFEGLIRKSLGEYLFIESHQSLFVDHVVNTEIVHIPPIDYVPDERGLGCVYYECMKKNKDKIALIEGLTGKTFTFKIMLERSIRLAISMRKLGIDYGDVISLHSHDQENCSVIFIAALFLGAIMSSVDTSMSREDTQLMLAQTMPKMVFVTSACVDKLENVLKNLNSNANIVVYGDSDKYQTLADLLAESTEEDAFRPVKVRSLLDTALIVFSSGSTGVPKSLCHNHHSALYQYNNFSKNFCWDVSVHFATPHWTIYTKFLGITTILGTTRIYYPDFYNTLWHFAKYKITTAFLSTAEILALSKQARPKNLDLGGLNVIVGGATLNSKQLERLHKVFYDSNIYFGYGFSEIPSGMTTFRPKVDDELRHKKSSSVGFPLPGFSFKIVNPKTDKILGPYENGEIRIKTSFPISGYHKNHSLSFWDTYGWLRTGDLAYYDEDNCIYIIGRIKEIFKYQDYHVIPAVIENVLKTHEAVHQAAVIGVPHDIEGHHPMGVVTLKNKYQEVSPEEIRQYVDRRVHCSHQLRCGVKIVDEIPLSPSGKVRRFLVQQLILKEMGKDM